MKDTTIIDINEDVQTSERTGNQLKNVRNKLIR